ncbi:DUF5343 domain-containing protein [Pseudaestuariivita rosea]|uniref:DUF5343 domain-containing protein n=1 Tax=Pseudaestuariivita rosea TaxID=2763263 RepID=UPI001ABBA959|nr:DUF5343 domain-containing protein [Pseudaestuariivita rosea]
MALLKQTTQIYTKLGEFFDKLREGQAPSTFNRTFLKDLGLTSSNWHSTIGLMKGLGFLSADGTPTNQYMDFLDKTRWKIVLGEAVREAYSDIFVMKREPSPADLDMIVGKYKSTYNMSDTSADRAARTFLALYELSDKQSIIGGGVQAREPELEVKRPDKSATSAVKETTDSVQPQIPVMQPNSIGLNYNIQIHLPATKDIEVYNAIFKSLREHIIE